MSDSVPICITLKSNRRTAEDQAVVQHIAGKLGYEVTGTGQATISARIPVSKFASLFGQAAAHLSARLPGGTDYGMAAGYAAADLPVPAELAERVDSITVQPPPTRFSASAL